MYENDNQLMKDIQSYVLPNTYTYIEKAYVKKLLKNEKQHKKGTKMSTHKEENLHL